MLPFFYYFAAMTVLSAVCTVALRNPVYGILALMVMFFHVAGLFILLDAEFLAALQIIIYAGAVLVLYLFALMLLNLKSEERFVHRKAAAGVGLGVVLVGEIVLLLSRSPWAGPGPGTMAIAGTGGPAGAIGNSERLGILLFTDYLLPFELVGVLLLGGMVGALILAKEPPHEPDVPGPAG